MKKMKSEVKIGVFGVLSVFLLYWGISFLKGTNIFSTTDTYYAYYEKVNGIQRSAPVSINGFTVGRVEQIEYLEQEGRMRFSLRIRSKYSIPVDSKVQVFSGSLLSGKQMEIDLGTSPKMLQDGQTIASEYTPGALETGRSEFEEIKAKVYSAIDEFNTTMRSVSALLDSANLASIRGTLANVNSISGNLNSVVADGKGDIQALIRNLNTISRNLAEASPRINSMASRLDAFSDTLATMPLGALVENAERTMASLNTTIARLESSDGTAGLLLTNPDLYNELTESSRNLNLLLEDLRTNPKRYVSFSLFGRKDKDKDKNKAPEKEPETETQK